MHDMEYVDLNKWKKIANISALCFVYKKKDGTIRKAVGTRNVVVARYYGFEPELKGSGRSSPNSYFDFQRNDWRCYSDECNDEIGLIEGQEKLDFLEEIGLKLTNNMNDGL